MKEEEILFNDSFYSIVLKDMGLKRFTDIPEESRKVREVLSKIGTIKVDWSNFSLPAHLDFCNSIIEVEFYEME